MTNDNIKDTELSPNLEEKAERYTDVSELIEPAAENDVELSEDVLKSIAGGTGWAETMGLDTKEVVASMNEIAMQHKDELRTVYKNSNELEALRRLEEISLPIMTAKYPGVTADKMLLLIRACSGLSLKLAIR